MDARTLRRLPRLPLRLGACGGLALLAACGLPLEPAPGLRVPAPELRGHIDTVCLSPCTVTFDFPDRAAKLAALQGEIRSVLEGAGFIVVPSDAVVEVFRQVNEDEGGYFDPHFGWRDEPKWQRVRTRAYGELERRHQCDALLLPAIAMVVAPWANGTARWDGVEDSMASTWSALGSFGRVPALSLWITVRDMQDREIYFHTGGIQVVQQLRDSFLRSSFEFVSENDLLADQNRNRNAVRASLAEFLAAGGR
jgi:hypothetical protein